MTVKSVVATNISTEDLEEFKCLLQKCFAQASYNFTKSKTLYLPCDNYKEIMKELFLYLYVLDDWEQNPNGSTTGYYNRISLEDLNNIIQRTKQICGC